MPSSLSWIDFDSEAQQRAQRILTLFKERDTRDELGFGPIRDAISDSLFPGTSTLHTRLRYMLFIPWMYQVQEEKQVPSARIREYSRWEQLNLAEMLKANSPNELGVIGGEVKDRLKTLPSALYWSGLGRWGIRVYPGTEGQYQGALDEIYRRRKRTRASLSSAAEDGDDVGGLWELGAHTFHPGLPPVPGDFPSGATFRLTREEGRYLQERLRQRCTGSLLSDLLADPVVVSINAPWEHPNLVDFSPAQRELVHHGAMFSLAAEGAAILYNLMLSEIIDAEERVSDIRGAGLDWTQRLSTNSAELVRWAGDLPKFWAAVHDRGHEIGPRAVAFVEEWIAAILEYRDQVFDSPDARRLVRNREIEKKKANSRFTNSRVRDQWGGRSGMRPMIYRWPLIQSYIRDMAEALK